MNIPGEPALPFVFVDEAAAIPGSVGNTILDSFASRRGRRLGENTSAEKQPKRTSERSNGSARKQTLSRNNENSKQMRYCQRIIKQFFWKVTFGFCWTRILCKVIHSFSCFFFSAPIAHERNLLSDVNLCLSDQFYTLDGRAVGRSFIWP